MSDYFALGDLDQALAAMPSRAKVHFDTGEVLATLCSYRGYYSHLAITPEPHYPAAGAKQSTILRSRDGVAHSVEVGATGSVAQVRRALALTRGNEFYGYKGGEFLMDDTTALHVAPYGDTTPVVIVGVRLEGNRVIVETTSDDY